MPSSAPVSPAPTIRTRPLIFVQIQKGVARTDHGNGRLTSKGVEAYPRSARQRAR